MWGLSYPRVKSGQSLPSERTSPTLDSIRSLLRYILGGHREDGENDDVVVELFNAAISACLARSSKPSSDVAFRARRLPYIMSSLEMFLRIHRDPLMTAQGCSSSQALDYPRPRHCWQPLWCCLVDTRSYSVYGKSGVRITMFFLEQHLKVANSMKKIVTDHVPRLGSTS